MFCYKIVLSHIKRGDLLFLISVRVSHLLGFCLGFFSMVFPDCFLFLLKEIRNSFHTIRCMRKISSVGQKTIFQYYSRFFNPQYISIGKRCLVADFSLLEAPSFDYSLQQPVMKLGDGCIIGEYNHITCTNKIIIGDNFLTGRFA